MFGLFFSSHSLTSSTFDSGRGIQVGDTSNQATMLRQHEKRIADLEETIRNQNQVINKVLGSSKVEGGSALQAAVSKDNDFIMESFDKWINRWHDVFVGLTSKQKQAGSELEGHIYNFNAGTGQWSRRPQLQGYYEHIVKNKANIKKVCEIGFNGGHSAMMFSILFDGNIDITSFDLCLDRRCDIGRSEILARYPNVKLEIVRGDSTIAVPNYASKNPYTKCDFISVDGGHFGNVPRIDLQSMKALANMNHLLVFDDVDSSSPIEYLRTVGLAWDYVIAERIVEQTEPCTLCYSDSNASTCHFCFGKYLD